MWKTFNCVGCLVGTMIAWYLNHSVVWALVGFIFGWLYVLVAVCKHVL
jgi:hypothetical protein